MNDHTCGNSTISMDWGNATIDCGTPELKDLLRDLAEHYLEILQYEQDKISWTV